jgi:hypothetical protein
VKRRAVLTGVLAWVLVVTVASGVTWAVIEGAGQSLMAGGDPVAETRPVPGPALSESAESPQPSAKPSKHGRPRPSASSTPSRAAASPTAVPSRRPGTTAAPPRSPAPASGDSSEDNGVERTWEGPPGLVTVRCDGSRTTLRSATPNNGYRVEVDRGSTRIEVHFESASREYKVEARCFDGEPRFAVEGGGEDEHDE